MLSLELQGKRPLERRGYMIEWVGRMQRRVLEESGWLASATPDGSSQKAIKRKWSIYWVEIECHVQGSIVSSYRLSPPFWLFHSGSPPETGQRQTLHTNTANTTFLWVLNIVADPTLNVFVSPDFTVTNVRLCHPCRPQGKDGKQMFSSQFWWTGLIVNCTNPGFPERNSPVKLMQYSLSVSTRAAKWKHTFWEGPNEHLKRRKYRLEKSTISLNLKFYRAEYCIVSCNLEQQGMIVLHKAQ